MCSPNINKSFLKVLTLLILRHIVALGTKTGKFYTDVQQRNGCNYHLPVFTVHTGCAGAPAEVRSFPTEFHRSTLELGKGIVPENLILLPARERNVLCSKMWKFWLWFLRLPEAPGVPQDQLFNVGLKSHV